jgi:AcrR family transcriptional regulator
MVGVRAGRKIEILKSAASTFVREGYDATSMNHIAEEAGITKPGLYYHFKSKQDLLFQIMSYALDRLEKDTIGATVSSASNEERLRTILGNHARMITEDDDCSFTMLVMNETSSLRPEDQRIISHRKRAHFEVVRATLDQLGKEGRLRDIDTTVAAFSILGTVIWICKWFQKGGRLPGDQVVSQVSELVMASILRDDRRT